MTDGIMLIGSLDYGTKSVEIEHPLDLDYLNRLGLTGVGDFLRIWFHGGSSEDDSIDQLDDIFLKLYDTETFWYEDPNNKSIIESLTEDERHNGFQWYIS